MRIEGSLLAQDAQATDSTRRTGIEAALRSGGPSAPVSSPADRIELSGDAGLRVAALRAATDSPAVRTDRVEAAREKLLNERIGADPLALADAILKELIP